MASPESVTIVVPAFNEGHSIGQVVAALREAAPWHEVLVIDDGSTDGTGKAAEVRARGFAPSLHKVNAPR